MTFIRMICIFVVALCFCLLGTVEASLGNMGFMKLKQVQGGFNGDVIEVPLVLAKPNRRILPKPSSSTKSRASPVAPVVPLPDPIQPKTTTTTETVPVKPVWTQEVSFSNRPLYRFDAIVVGANFVGLLFSMFLRGTSRHYHVDLFGSGAFALAAAPFLLQAQKELDSTTSQRTQTATTIAAQQNAQRIKLTSVAVLGWSVRLATYLFVRVVEQGGDGRLDAIMQNPLYAAGFWAFSSLWGMICGLPYSMGLTSSSVGTANKKVFQTGMGIFAAGWLIETVADYQKWIFKHAPADGAGVEFCNVGLWGLSQHPNWFGDLLVWSGLWIANAPSLIEKPKKKGFWHKVWSFRRLAVAALGPFFLWRLFDQQSTGRMLTNTFTAKRKTYGYGSNPDYTKYIDRKSCCCCSLRSGIQIRSVLDLISLSQSLSAFHHSCCSGVVYWFFLLSL